ncbi:hydrogenase expression/formation protein HypC [Modestobacter sp. DSM 44400]|uniref:HypC/HybG/HupF family hydrogenase formation chaperone n=1 Tax=Modestobacter sp. DSM 44400 TaxID=1550230 RepID=UPI00089AE32E|nr:HypC/HybG/HupF family hydrogenase formation chaperone [Modestobacter sp. DSM 44400]SDY56630.1 hydrogenase expression/formation protein HypC [Modestobacter sp. DSM 44400]
MCLGIPGQIIEISDVAQLRVTVDIDGVPRSVSVALIGLDGPDGAQVGDWVVVHTGFAMAKISETEARETLDALEALSDMYENELTDSADIDGLDASRRVASRQT